jgi:hypothetical protein
MEPPSRAGAAFLLPGLVNGYGKVERTLRQQAEVLDVIEERLTRIERTLNGSSDPARV